MSVAVDSKSSEGGEKKPLLRYHDSATSDAGGFGCAGGGKEGAYGFDGSTGGGGKGGVEEGGGSAEEEEDEDEVRRILLVQSDYWAVLNVDPTPGVGDETPVAMEQRLRKGYRMARDRVEAGPEPEGGKTRTEALTVLRSAYSTLSNPVTRALYHGWRAVFHHAATPPPPELTRERQAEKGDCAGDGDGDRDRDGGEIDILRRKRSGNIYPAGPKGSRAGGRRRRHLPTWLVTALRVPVLGVLAALLLTLLSLPLVLAVGGVYCVWFLLCLPIRMCADMNPGSKRHERRM